MGWGVGGEHTVVTPNRKAVGSADRRAVQCMHSAEREACNRASCVQFHSQVSKNCLQGCRNPLPKHVQCVLYNNAMKGFQISMTIGREKTRSNLICLQLRAHQKKHAMETAICGLGAAPSIATQASQSDGKDGGNCASHIGDVNGHENKIACTVAAICLCIYPMHPPTHPHSDGLH